jgi:hypothetical protein
MYHFLPNNVYVRGVIKKIVDFLNIFNVNFLIVMEF